MNYFKTIGAALDASLDAICTHLKLDRDEAFVAVRNHLETMSNQWFSGHTPRILYADPLCRFAYLYCHTAVNANVCEKIIWLTPSIGKLIVNKLQNESELSVCAFGGGPGTELLALSKYILKVRPNGPNCRLSFTLLDRVAEWAESWNALEREITDHIKEKYGAFDKWPFTIQKAFIPQDITRVEDYANFETLLGCDLFILNYVLSELLGGTGSLGAVLARCADAAPAGSKFLVIDRDYPVIKKQARDLLTGASLVCSRPQLTAKNMDNDEQCSVLQHYIDKIGRNPRVQWRGAFWVVGTKHA